MKLKILTIIFISVWITILGRVYFLSVKSNIYYEQLAEKNTIKSEPIIPIRGTIYDRNLEPLAVNKLGFSIAIRPNLKSKKREYILDDTLSFISSILLDQNITKLKKIYKKGDSPYNHDFVEVIPFIPYENFIPHYTKFSLNDKIEIKPATLRHYPNANVASHILGYVSSADSFQQSADETTSTIGVVGKSGIERFFNQELQGELGSRKYQVTAFNKEVEELERIEASQNQDIVLTIDIRLQRYIHSLFENIAGVVVVADARNGAILSAGSFPEYNINKFVTGITKADWDEMSTDFNHPFLNKLVNSNYPPGSIIKPTVALSFLESNLIDEKTIFEDEGFLEYGGRKFRCWKNDGHGRVDMRRSIAESCDVYYYKGSFKVGINDISEKLLNYGFGTQTGIELPNEFIGIVPNKEWKLKKFNKSWFVGETFITSIGQGSFLVTPVQVARNTAIIASGKMQNLTLVKSIRGVEFNATFTQSFTTSDLDNIDLIRKSMTDTLNAPFGTASKYVDAPVIVAGKTGTAQVVGIPQEEKNRMKESELEYFQRSHAWLTTYAPAYDPKYVVTVLIEHGGHGGNAAGPIVGRIYQKLFELGYFE